MNSQWFPTSFAKFGKPFPSIDGFRFACYETEFLTYSCVSTPRICFQMLVETPPCSALAFRGLLESLKSCGEFFLVLKRFLRHQIPGSRLRHHQIHRSRVRHRRTFTGSTFLLPLTWHSAFCLKERNDCKRTLRNFMIFNKRRRWFHSSRVQLPLVDMSSLKPGFS